MRKILIFFCFLILYFSAESKSLKGYLKAKKDTNYIESYYNDLIIRMYSGEKTPDL